MEKSEKKEQPNGVAVEGDEAQRKLLDELLTVDAFQKSVYVHLDMAAFVERKEHVTFDIKPVLEEAIAKGVAAGFDRSVIASVLAKHVEETISARPLKRPTSKPALSLNEAKLRKLITDARQVVRRRLEAIPNGLHKAELALAYDLSKFDNPSPDSLSFFGPIQGNGKWSNRVSELRQRLHDNNHGSVPNHLTAEHSERLACPLLRRFRADRRQGFCKRSMWRHPW
jgi:hypothetical protein